MEKFEEYSTIVKQEIPTTNPKDQEMRSTRVKSIKGTEIIH